MLPDGKIILFNNKINYNSTICATMSEIQTLQTKISHLPFSLISQNTQIDKTITITLPKSISQFKNLFIIQDVESTESDYTCMPFCTISNVNLYMGYRYSLPFVCSIYLSIAYPYIYCVEMSQNFASVRTVQITDVTSMTIDIGTYTSITSVNRLVYGN